VSTRTHCTTTLLHIPRELPHTCTWDTGTWQRGFMMNASEECLHG
jgi:hypothetical protein